MKKLFIFAIIAFLASCGGNGCSRSVDSSDSARVDTTVVDTLSKDSVNNLDLVNVDSLVK